MCYRIFIHRRKLGRKAHRYAFSRRQAIPQFPLPLLPGDAEPVVELGTILHDLYDRERYRLIIDYGKPPVPNLSEADATWAASALAQPAG